MILMAHPPAGTNCSWGRAINVAERYIYVTQPRLDRVLVVSVPQMVVVDVSTVWSCPCVLPAMEKLCRSMRDDVGE